MIDPIVTSGNNDDSSGASRKFSRDVLWNAGGLAVAGVAGIALSALVGLVYGAAALGAFNQVFAAYLFSSQLAVLGVHHSALAEIAATDDPRSRAGAATSALLLAAGIGAVVAAGFWLAAPLVAAVLESPAVATGMRWATPAIAMFAVTKVNLAAAVAVRRMRWYAVLNAGRIVWMLGGFAACVALDARPAVLPVILSVSELATLLLSLVAIRDLVGTAGLADLGARIRRHLGFGLKGVMSGVVAELNTRIDVLMLGYYAGDAVVGIYSFAATLAEGAFQLLIVLRTNYAPVVARLWAAGERRALAAMIRRGRNRTYLAAVPVAAAAIAGYSVIAPLVIDWPLVADSGRYFAVLLAGMAAVAGYVPFSQILLQARRPGWHTYLIALTAGTNVAANALLIRAVGPLGAALATAIALVVMIVALRLMTRRLLDLRI